MPVICTSCRTEYEVSPGRCPTDGCATAGGRIVRSYLGHLIDGRYEIVSILGSGAVSTVWLGVHLHTSQPLAIKVLEREYGASVDKAFLHELRATSRANSAHTVAIRDGGRLDDDRFFIAMEYVEGVSLRDRLDEHRRHGAVLPYRGAILIAEQVCMALACAHRLGVVHQDLKPSNILLTERDGSSSYVKVLDFGFARLFGPQSADALVGDGFAAGTPAYIAPERLSLDARIDHRSDLYSLGVILFEMLAGERPFDRDDPVATARARLEGPPPRLADKRPLLPAPLCALVDALLSRDPDARPAHADAVRERLDTIKRTNGSSILDLHRGAARRRRRTFRGLLGLA